VRARPAEPTVTAVSQPLRDVLFIRDDYNVRGPGQIAVVDAAAGRLVRSLPLGLPTPDWSAVYSTSQSGGKTTIQATNPATGQRIRETTVEGPVDLAGMSPNGRWLGLQALVSEAERKTFDRDGHWKSQFLILAGDLKAPPDKITLDGNFWLDALADDGAALYLIENLPPVDPTHYQVRLYDLGKKVLQPGAIADKSGSEVMSGTRWSSLPSPDGTWLYSLYLNQASGPFIHALNLADRFAFCIDLPATGKGDFEKQLLWSMAMTPDGRTIHAANGALGLIAEVNLGQLRVARTATLPVGTHAQQGLLDGLARELFPTAEAKRLLQGGAALSPDGGDLFVIAEKGLLAIETAGLTLRRSFLPDWTLDSVAVSPDGSRVYVVSAERGLVLALDPASGETLATIRGADHPWGVLRVARSVV
jgi:YVTN family beta-propeller protein